MKMRRLFNSLIFLLAVAAVFPMDCPAETVTEGNVTLVVGRVLDGAETGTRYYGYNGGRIQLPHDRGGMLSFDLWNDLQLNGTAHANYFNAVIAGVNIRIANYATIHQIREEYNQFRGTWGPAGVYRYTLAIPPGTKAFDFNTSGSVTGIEMSNVRFSDPYHALAGGYERNAVRPFGKPVIRVGRVLNGTTSGRTYYGYLHGTVFLPNGKGGTLSFNLYNDQQSGFHSTLNQMHLSFGTRNKSIEQYTTSMDLQEMYKGLENDWGPAGGAFVAIPIDRNVTHVDFDQRGSRTGIEIADVVFRPGTPVSFQFNERVNRTSEVLKNFPRVLHGARSGKTFYGCINGSIILPHNKGGTLSFSFYNDHNANTAKTTNQLNISAGTVKRTVNQTTWQADRWEFYKEFSGQWGPAGGTQVRIPVPPGTSSVSFNHSGSDTGFELSDFVFGS